MGPHSDLSGDFPTLCLLWHVIRLLKNPISPRLLKKVQLQGGAPQAERDVLEVRRSECRGTPTQQMGRFEPPMRAGSSVGRARD